MARSTRVLAFMDNIWAGLVGSVIGALATGLWAYAGNLPWHTIVVLCAVSFTTLTIIIDKTRDLLGRFQSLSDRLQVWILESGYSIGIESPPTAEFLFRVTTRDDRRIVIVLPSNSKEIIMSAGIVFPPGDIHLQGLASLNTEKRNEALWILRTSLIQMGVFFGGIDWPLESISLSVHVPTDSLSRDSFNQGITHLHRALHFVMASVNRYPPPAPQQTPDRPPATPGQPPNR